MFNANANVTAHVAAVTLLGRTFAAVITSTLEFEDGTLFKVMDMATRETFDVKAAALAPMMVEAHLRIGGTADVQIIDVAANGWDFKALFLGQIVDLPRAEIIRVLLPAAATAAA